MSSESKGANGNVDAHAQNGKKKPNLIEDTSDIPIPPDGGWGWMVVLGSFIVHIIADGVAYSFGVVTVELLKHFDAGRAQFGLIGAIMVGLTMGVGPIASMMESRWGCRVVTIIGTFVCSFGFFISIFAPNVYFMYISFGVIGGTGFGIIYLPAITCVSYYFEKKRAFATGLAVCGSGLGTFLLAPLINMCLDEYGWRGTVLIESGLLLNCAVSGMLFRPLEAPRKKRSPTNESAKALISGKTSISEHPVELKAVRDLKEESGISSSMHNIHSGASGDGAAHLRQRHHHSHEHLHHHHAHVVSRKDQFYPGSVESLAEYRADPGHYTASVTRLNTSSHEDTPVADSAADTSNPCPCLPCLSLDKRRSLNKIMDISLFADVFFELFAWSNFLTNFTFFIPFMFLPDRAVNLGESEERGALLVSVIGIFNTAGRIIFGFISDLIPQYRLFVYNTSLALCGVVTCLSAFFPAYPYLAAYAGSYGLLVGVYVTLTPVIIVDLLGLEKLSNAFGWVLMFQGIATALGPPIAGWLFDETGNYISALWLFGSMMTISGVMLYPIPCIGKCLNKPWNNTQKAAPITKDIEGKDYKAVSQSPDSNVV